MKKRKARSGFALSDALIGLIIICLGGLTYAQAHSLMVKRLATQEAVVADKRHEVEKAWSKRVPALQSHDSSSKIVTEKETTERSNRKQRENAESKANDKTVEMTPLEEVATP